MHVYYSIHTTQQQVSSHHKHNNPLPAMITFLDSLSGVPSKARPLGVCDVHAFHQLA